MDAGLLEKLITAKTKAIVPVHYGGIACDMDKIMSLALTYKLAVVEDAAQAIDSYYRNKPLGSIGHLAAFSFHETKNVIAGEGGMLVINDEKYFKRAEIIREKGTNRSAFFRGEVAKYNWVDLRSSFLPSEITSAFLFAQLEHLDTIQAKRKKIWNTYYQALLPLEKEGKIKLPFIPDYASNNAHLFYILCSDLETRSGLIDHLNREGILSVFHYLSLHKSPFYLSQKDAVRTELPNSDYYSDHLLRLPFYYELEDMDLERIIGAMKKFFG